jgi:alkylated DNA repair protein (DNA oxidative demethylase)
MVLCPAWLSATAKTRDLTGTDHTGFAPDACLINRYIADAKLGLHQDRVEKDAWAPI